MFDAVTLPQVVSKFIVKHNLLWFSVDILNICIHHGLNLGAAGSREI